MPHSGQIRTGADCPRPLRGTISTFRSMNPEVRSEVLRRRFKQGMRRRQDQRVQADGEGQEQVCRRSSVRPAVPHSLRRRHAHADARRRQRRQGRKSNPSTVLRSWHQHALLWDSLIIEHVSKSEDFWLNDLAALDTAENRTEWMKGTVEDWATESLLAARQAYQVPETGVRLKSGQKLGDVYQDKSLPVVRRRLSQAGLRLAMVLNEAFAE